MILKSEYTRTENLDNKNNRYYTVNNETNRIITSQESKLRNMYPENTRLKSKANANSYTPNPSASNIPFNNQSNFSPDKLVPITTRQISNIKN